MIIVYLLLQGTDEGRDVTIPAGCWIIWAIPTGAVRTLTVDGNLEFIDGQDISLTATYIVVKVKLYFCRILVVNC